MSRPAPTNSMEPPRFVNHYRTLFSWLMRIALPTPWLEKTMAYLCYDTFVAAMVSYTVFCYLYSIVTTSISFQDLCLMGISGTQHIFGLVITVYYLRFGERLKRITDDMDKIVDSILRSDLGGSEFLQQLYQKNSKLMGVLTSNSLVISFMTPFTYFLTVPLTDWFAGEYREHTALPIVGPYDGKQPVVYELMALLIPYSIAYSSSRKSITDCLFLSLFDVQTTFLKCLSESQAVLQREFLKGDNDLIRSKLIVWAKLHQQILRNIEELIAAFSPVVIIYSVTLINIIVCGLVVQVKKDNDNFFQSFSIGSYVAITILYYYLLSNIADQLTSEAQRLASIIYGLPWFEVKKMNTDMIRMVLTKCNTPVQVTAYRGPVFLLNREMFAKFMVTVISAFVTFCQIKDLYG